VLSRIQKKNFLVPYLKTKKELNMSSKRENANRDNLYEQGRFSFSCLLFKLQKQNIVDH
jgi:hypothetical protein